MRILIFLALFLCTTSDSSVDIVPLYNLEVDWVIQGYNFGFQGFMVEFMGYMKVCCFLVRTFPAVHPPLQGLANDWVLFTLI